LILFTDIYNGAFQQPINAKLYDISHGVQTIAGHYRVNGMRY